MSIYHYTKKNPHPAGYFGYRVSVMIEGDQKQKYFSTRNATKRESLLIEADAVALEDQWLLLKDIAENKRNNKAVPTARSTTGTGVRGIAVYKEYRRNRQGERTHGFIKRYDVAGSYKSAHYHKKFPFTEKGWVAAVTFLAKSKHLTRWKHLIKRKNMLGSFA